MPPSKYPQRHPVQWYNLGEGESGERRGSPAAAPLGEKGREGVRVGPKPLRSVTTREGGRKGHTTQWGGDRGMAAAY